MMRGTLCGLIVFAVAGLAHAHSGHTVWGSWRFDWEVSGSTGLGIRQVHFNNKKLLWKANMPVIRVRYQNDTCGPYQDRITWGSLVKISNCGGKKVCQKSFTDSNGRNWLRLGILARIGQYRLNQVWFFSDDGWIYARLSSKGLQCKVDHDHHAYWRMDFDIDGAASDQAFVRTDGVSEGWGPGWHKYIHELDQLRDDALNRVWFMRDSPTADGAWIMPGTEHDGPSDSFSNKDVGIRRYHGNEDESWPFGAWGHLGYLNNENVEEKDNILWYVGHLHHEQAEGGGQWHRIGPWIKVHHE